jgi:hypothetical protein
MGNIRLRNVILFFLNAIAWYKFWTVEDDEYLLVNKERGINQIENLLVISEILTEIKWYELKELKCLIKTVKSK